MIPMMPRIDNFEIRAKRFAYAIYPFVKDCHHIHQFCNAVEQFNDAHGTHVEVDWGQTRVAFLCSDFVVKMDYGKRSIRWGGCEDECEMYALAEREGYAYLFAKIIPIEVREVKMYAMPRVHGVGDYDDDVYEFLTQEEVQWLNDHTYDLHCHNYGWEDGKPVIFDYACNPIDPFENDYSHSYSSSSSSTSSTPYESRG